MTRTILKLIAGVGLMVAMTVPCFAQAYGWVPPASWGNVYDGRTNPNLVPFGSGMGLTWGAPPIGLQGGGAEAMLYDYQRILGMFGQVGQGGGFGRVNNNYTDGVHGRINTRGLSPYNQARMNGWAQRENEWLLNLANTMTMGYR